MDESIPRVLLVEDEAAHAGLIVRAFESWAERMDLTVVSTIAEARARIAEAPRDLVLADLRLPDGSGIELLPAEGEEPRLPLVVLTAHGDEQTAVEAMKRGALDYVVKSESALADAPHIAQRALREWNHILQRKRAEEALQQSEERYRVAFENANIGVALVGLDGRYLWVNPMLCRMLDYSPEELLSKTVHNTAHPDGAHLCADFFRRALAGEVSSATFETRHLQKQGGILWGRTTCSLTRDAQGRPVHFISHVQDITACKRADERIRRQAAVLQAINHVFRQAITCETKEQLGKTCLAVAERLTDSKFGFLGELNTAGLFDTIAISDPGWSACKLAVADARRSLKDMRIRGIDRSTVRDGRSRIVKASEMATHPDRVGTPEGHPELTAFLGVPLKQEGKTIGMIGLGNKHPAYDAADQEAVQTLSVAIVEALRNKRAEEARRESEAKYRDLFEAANDVISILDANGEIVDINRRAEELTGFTKQELLGKNVLRDLIVPEDQQRIREVFQNLARSISQVYEVRWRAKDGSVLQFEGSSSPRTTQEGNFVGPHCILRDVSDRKRAEEALARSQAEWETTFNAISDCVFLIDLEGRVLRSNLAADNFWGVPRPYILGQKCYRLVHDLEEPLQCCPLPRALHSWQRESIEVREPHADRWLQITVDPVGDGHGNLTGAVHIVRDITGSKRAEEAYRALVDHSLQGLVILQQGRIVFANRAMAEISGYSIEEMLALSPAEIEALVHPEDRALLRDRHRGRLGGEPLPERYEFRGIRKDGFVCWLEIHAKRIEYQGKLAVQTAYVDVTQHKRAEEKLRAMEAQVAHVGRLATMGEMLAGIAHEVNQPLYSLINFAKASRNVLAAEGPPNLDELRHWNDEIATAAARAGNILRQLRDFARRAEPRYSRANVNEVVQEGVELVAFEARRRQVAVQLEPCEASVPVDLDRVQIQQVLVNLLRNAYEAIEQGGVETRQVTISTCVAGQFVEVSVADSGPGLPADQQLKIFEPFVTTKPDGLGMGLPISKTIVEAHGGTLWASSNPGGGAVFHFTLPTATGDRTDVE